MPTELPTIFSEEHDFSAVETSIRSQRALSAAKMIIAIGAASLAAGAGVGLAAFGLSYVLEPKIIETTKVVTETKIEKVEVEKPVIVEREKVVTVDRPVVTEKIIQAPPAPVAPLPAPRLGERSTAERFSQSQEFQNAEFHGRIKSFIAGRVLFENGRSFVMSNPSGVPTGMPTSSQFNGELAYCHHAGEFPNGRQIWPCYVLHNGVVTNVNSARNEQPREVNDDPFGDLFR